VLSRLIRRSKPLVGDQLAGVRDAFRTRLRTMRRGLQQLHRLARRKGEEVEVIGMAEEEPINRCLRKLPVERLKPAEGEATISGVAVETDDQSGLALKIAPMRIGGRLEPVLPAFWE